MNNDNLLNWLRKTWHIEPINLSYYLEALTHKSYSNENNLHYSYQRLEWLGDTVINMFVTEYLYNKYPNFNEGDLTNLRAKIVQSNAEIMVAKQLDIQNYILLGHGMIKSKNNDKIFEDCFESMIGAIYLDLGYKIIKNLLEKILFNGNQNIILNKILDYKTLVQQIFSKKKIKNTTYNTKQIGINNFKTILKGKSSVFGIGQGHNKKISEKLAAKDAYEKFQSKKE